MKYLLLFPDSPSPDIRRDTLTQLSIEISELMELEQDNKWLLLTMVEIRHALRSFEDIPGLLDRLRTIDPIRKGYYDDLR